MSVEDDLVIVQLNVRNMGFSIETMLDAHLARVKDLAHKRIREAVEKFDVEAISKERIGVSVRGWVDRQIEAVIRSTLGDRMLSAEARKHVRNAVRAELRSRRDSDRREQLHAHGWYSVTHGPQNGLVYPPSPDGMTYDQRKRARTPVTLDTAWRRFKRARKAAS